MTPKQQRFIEEYLIDLNGAQAAIRAGYSKKGADVAAARLLGDVRIKAEIDRAIQARSKRTEIDQDRVLKELACIGFSKLTDMVTWGEGKASLKASEQLTEAQARSISEINCSGDQTRIKLYDKRAALVDLGKHLGMFKDTVKVDIPGGVLASPVAVQPDGWATDAKAYQDGILHRPQKTNGKAHT